MQLHAPLSLMPLKHEWPHTEHPDQRGIQALSLTCHTHPPAHAIARIRWAKWRERVRCLNCGKARISPGSSPIDVSRKAQLGRRPSFEEGKKSLQLNFSFSHFAPPPSSFSFPLANSPRGQLSFARLLEIARKLKKKRRMEKEN